MPEVVVTETFRCNSSPDQLWPVVTDTDRLNQLSGMSAIEMEPIQDAGAARYLVRTSLDGFPVSYLEFPYQWQRPSWYAVRREMQSGPTAWLQMRFDLQHAQDGGTEFTLELRLFPKFLPLVPVAKVLGGRRMRIMARAIQDIDEQLQGQVVQAARPAHGVDKARLRGVVQALERVPPERQSAAQALIELVRSAPDHELLRVRPFELAERWSMDREVVLEAALDGVEAGLLVLSWDLICPSCQTMASRVEHLWELDEEGHCQLCEIGFALPLDQAVEATFRPPEALRPLEEVQFCSGGPALTPHVFSQKVLPAGGEVQLALPEEAGQLRLFVRGGLEAPVLLDPKGPEQASVQVGEEIEAVHARPGGQLKVSSALADDRHLKLEHQGWASQAATAAHLATNSLFRRRFSGEVLAPGRTLEIRRISLLFSDLTGSTALYAREGDASAYRLVQDHFDLLFAVIAEHRGAVVKTIGDAVMAAFDSEDDALACGLAMMRRWPDFQAPRPVAEDVWLKLGMFSGPCYAVTANGLLDYFGQTVNVAARLQGASDKHELVVTQELAQRAAYEDLLGDARLAEQFQAHLKGLDGPMPCARLRIGDAG